MTTFVVENNDSGSLKVGESAGDYKWEVGSEFTIGDKNYKVSYIMGKKDKTHLCCKGCGIIPTGKVEYTIKK